MEVVEGWYNLLHSNYYQVLQGIRIKCVSHVLTPLIVDV